MATVKKKPGAKMGRPRVVRVRDYGGVHDACSVARTASGEHLSNDKISEKLERGAALVHQPWRFLPHTFAMHLSGGKWVPYLYLVFLSNLLAAVISKGGGRVIVELPPRHGKLLAHDTPVLTPGGWTTHGELRVGDRVFGRDGSPVTVEGISEESIAEYEVSFCDGGAITCHADHEWLAFHGKEESARLFTTQQLIDTGVGSDRRWSFGVDYNVCVQFSERDLPLHPYCLGVRLMADVPGEGAIFDKVSSRAPGAGEMTEMTEIPEIDKRIPSQYLFSSQGQREELLAGIIDIGGNIDILGRVRIATVSLDFANDMMELARSLGAKPRLMKVLSASVVLGKQTVYTVIFYYGGSLPVVSPRKHTWVADKKGRRSIVGIRKVDGKPGRCIQVSGGIYLAGETLIPTHNSSFVSQWLPAWFLANWPNESVILTTYEATFAASWGKKVRNILNSNSDELGMSIAQDSAAAAYWHTTVGGGMMTAGVGGPITGKGGRLCAAKGTIVVTNAGFIEISQLSACYKGLLALSYDHESDALVWRKIHAFMESEYHGELVEIETAGGNKIRLTPEHPIYDRERGYREAGSFLPGDRVYTVALPVEQDLPNMREAEGGARDGMQSVLSEGEKGDNCSQLYLMWQGFREAALRIRKSIEARVGGFLLRCGVQPESSCRQKQSSLPRLRQDNATETEVLLAGMPSEDNRGSCLHGMRQDICSENDEDKILFCRMSESIHCQATTAIYHKGVSGNQGIDFWQRWRRMCSLWKNAERFTSKVEYASHRRSTKEQHAGEFSDAMRVVPLDDYQLREDTVAVARRVCDGTHTVYDIEVEGTHNFMGAGLLIENCLIDDPHKNWKEAMSGSITKSIQDWYDSTFYTRLEPGGTLIILHTRWTENDLIGYCLREHPDEDWTVVRFPALAEEDDILGRKPGEALCPERYNEPALEKIKKTLGSSMWNGLYQQRPSAMEGEIWLRSRWNYYSIRPKCSFVVQSWDTGFKKNENASYSVCQTWGVFEGGFCLLNQWRFRVEWPELERAASAQYLFWRPNAVLIEDKASGQSLIQALRRDTHIPVVAVTTDDVGGKTIRAMSVTPMHEARLLWIPDPDASDDWGWVSEFVDRFTVFPNGVYMDEIDAATQALAYLRDFSAITEVVGKIPRQSGRILSGFRAELPGSQLRL